MSNEAPFDLAGKRVWVAGSRGMVGSAIVRRLAREQCEILTADRGALDLRRQDQTESWIAANRPDVIFLAAAKVGGILANSRYPATFLYDNLMIETNVIEAAYRVSVQKLLLLGSSCIYPRLAEQPIVESALLSGPLEPTNEAYAIAKIAGVKLIEAYRTAMPTNLYGPEDNFDLASSHVIPALMRKAHEAKATAAESMVIWGTGSPRREFLHVDDCADALVHLMKTYSGNEHINVGSGEDHTINDIAHLIAGIVGYEGQLSHDTSKPDGTPRKLMSADKLLSMGWRPSISLEDGLASTYHWFLSHVAVRT